LTTSRSAREMSIVRRREGVTGNRLDGSESTGASKRSSVAVAMA